MSAELTRPLQWFRWHHGTYSDPKWMTIAIRANDWLRDNVTPSIDCHAVSRTVTRGDVVAVWAAMMETASKANPRGQLVGWNDEDIANWFGIARVEVEAIRHAMQGKTLEGDTLIAWFTRQPQREDPGAADRQKAKREREKGGVIGGDNTDSHAMSRRVTPSNARVEKSREEKKDQKLSSLRSDSSSAKPPTPPNRKLSDQEKSERLAQVTRDALAAYNATMALPKGLLQRASDVGFETKSANVKRCLTVAREICFKQYELDHITPQFWEDYFRVCQADDFTSGRTGGGKGHETWMPDFEYLTRKAVMIEVFEKATSVDAGEGAQA